MTVTVTNDSELTIPASVQRKAGFKQGDRLEFKVSKGVVTIAAKPEAAADDYTPAYRQLVDAALAAADADVKAGRVYGPFSVREATSFSPQRTKTEG